jgi:DNA modification methylase
MTVTILTGDARDMLATLPSGSARCAVTSPPYLNLRDYGVAGQIGLESDPADYIAALVDVFREVKRVLADDGTCWIVLGDCYGKDKQLQLMPYRVAMALRADGWILRSNIAWCKPNPMPESCKDRPTNAHESVFLLTKGPRYFYDADAVREASARPDLIGKTRRFGSSDDEVTTATRMNGHPDGRGDFGRTGIPYCNPLGRNMRNVWTIAPRNFRGAHFATFPPELAARCIKAGSAPGDTVLDPFFGAGTTGLVADSLGRDCIGIELNPAYADLARGRLGLAAAIQLEAAD